MEGIFVEVTFPPGKASRVQQDTRLKIAGARFEGKGKERKWVATLWFKDNMDYVAFLVAAGLVDVVKE